MKKLIINCSIFFCLSITFSLAQESGLAIRDVDIIRPKSKKILHHQTVYIEKGLIKYLGKAKDVVLPSNAIIIEARGKYLMPGLSEMHAHIPVPDSSGDHNVLSQTLFLYLAHGITTIRGMLGQPFHLNIQQELLNRNITYFPSNIYTSSPSFNGNTMPDIVTAETAVIKYKLAGYHFLKIHPGIKREVYEVISKTAKSEGIAYAGHVPVEVGILRALQSGQKTIDHLDGYIEAMAPPLQDLNQNGFFGFNVTDQLDLKKIKSLVKQTKSSGAWMVPTQSLFDRWFSPEDAQTMMQATEMIYMPSKTRYAWAQNKNNLINGNTYSKARYNKFIEARRKLMYALYKGKVNMLLGSDAPQVMNVPGYSMQHEMESWAACGIPAWKILQAGTSEVARFFKLQDHQGDIVIGHQADLILLDKSPVVDIRNIRNIEGVIHRGQWLSKDMIKDQLRIIAVQNE